MGVSNVKKIRQEETYTTNHEFLNCPHQLSQYDKISKIISDCREVNKKNLTINNKWSTKETNRTKI
jgi:hypothetical protein